MATGREISAVLSAAAPVTLRPPYSQYSRPAEVAVFVSQYRVISFNTSSGDFSGSLLLYVQLEKPGCPSNHAASQAGESVTA